MSDNYYRTGQAAKQLEVSSYQIRRLCECGLIDAELTSGKQWRIPASEVIRLKREGVPPIPQLLQEPMESVPIPIPYQPNGHAVRPEDPEDDDPEDLYGPPSEDVVRSAEDVTITENLLKKRKLERDFEEVEDFFREREQKRQAELAAARKQAVEVQSQKRRREWRDEWITYGLNSAPWGTPKEAEILIHEAIEDALSKLDPDQPVHLVRRLVDGAVEKGLAPWRQAESREKALEAALDRLPWAAKYMPDFADLKRLALNFAAEALDRLKPDATDWEMRESAKQAVQPVLHECEHREACQRVLASISLPGATSEELQDATDATREALAELQVGASQRQLEKARDTALVPIQRTLGEREERRQKQRQRETRRFGAELRVGFYLDHIKTYIEEEFEFAGGYSELGKEADRLREPIRKSLVDELTENPDMTASQIREYVEELVEELL